MFLHTTHNVPLTVIYYPVLNLLLPTHLDSLGLSDHQTRSIFAQLLQGQAEMKQQISELYRHTAEVSDCYCGVGEIWGLPSGSLGQEKNWLETFPIVLLMYYF